MKLLNLIFFPILPTGVPKPYNVLPGFCKRNIFSILIFFIMFNFD